jgi:hypothetical protein
MVHSFPSSFFFFFFFHRPFYTQQIWSTALLLKVSTISGHCRVGQNSNVTGHESSDLELQW